MKTILKMFVLFVLTSNVCYSQSIQSRIEFEVNTDIIIENQNYQNFINDVIPFIKDNSNKIENILLIGSASPEGNKQNNINLSNKRVNKIADFISYYIPNQKIYKSNDYIYFLSKIGLDESDYTKLRATYIEINLKEETQNKVDTIYIERRDTIREVNNFYYTEKVNSFQHSKPKLSIYNDIVSDLLFRVNIGSEIYFNKWAFFIEGSFSNWNLFGKTYNIDIWHTGFRRYFNDNYDKLFVEAYGNVGYFDTDLLSNTGKIGIFYGSGLGVGYVFDLCSHWKIYPIVRFGLYERIYYSDYRYINQGNINVSFNNYDNGKVNNTQNFEDKQSIIVIDKVITKEFFENSYRASYLGPTYIGIVIRKDFCFNKNK